MTVEAESLVGAPKEKAPGAGPANAPTTVVFDQSVQELKYQAPGALPSGPVWIVLRIKNRGSEVPARMLVSTNPGVSMTVEALGNEFLNFRVPATSDGYAPLTVQITWVSGVTLIDRIDFVPATDAVPLPKPLAPAKPTRILVLHGKSGKAKEEAVRYQLRLAGQGLPAPAAQPATAKLSVGKDDVVVLFSDNWTWEATGALKYLPAGVHLNGIQSAPFVYKPAGILGDFAALGVRADNAGALSSVDQDLFQGKEPAKAWLPQIMDLTSIPDNLVGKDSVGLMEALAQPNKGHVLGAAVALLAWLDSMESIQTPIAAAALDRLEAAVANVLYSSSFWELTDLERLLVGSLFIRLAAGANDVLKRENQQGGELSPDSLQRALGLLTAAEAFPQLSGVEDWRNTAQQTFDRSQGAWKVETTRGRLKALQCLLEYEARTGSSSPQINGLTQSLSAFSSPEAGVCTFGNEETLLGAGIFENAVPSLIRKPGDPNLVLLPHPLQGERSGARRFDKIMKQGKLTALIDGIASGAGGYDDAGALQWLSIGPHLWVAGPGTNQPSVNMQNGISAVLGGKPITFSPLAEAEAEVNGEHQGLIVIRRASDQGVNWKRAFFWFGEDAVILDEITGANSGQIELTSTLNLMGSAAEDKGSGRITLASGESRFTAIPLGVGSSELQVKEGERSSWRQKWFGIADPKLPVLFKTYLAPGGAEQAVGLQAPGIRLGTGKAAFLGPVQTPDCRIDAIACALSDHETILAGARRIHAGGENYFQSTAPTHLILHPDSLTVIANQAISVAIKIPEGTTITGASASRRGGISEFSVNPGRTEIRFSTPALMPLFSSLQESIRSIPEGEYGKPSEVVHDALPDQFVVLRSMGTEEPVNKMLSLSKSEEINLAISSGKKVLSADSVRLKGSIATLQSEITALESLDIDKDGVWELAVGCEDGSISLFDAKGEELGKTKLDDEVSSVKWLKAIDVENDSLLELAVMRSDGAMAILDSMGLVKWEQQISDATCWGFGDWDGNGRVDVFVVSAKNGSSLLTLDPNGEVHSNKLPANDTPVLDCLVLPTADGVPRLITALENGGLESWQWQNGAMARQITVKFSSGPIQCLASVGGNTQVFAGSSSGEIALISLSDLTKTWSAKLEAPVQQILPMKDESVVAITAEPSLYLLSQEGAIRAKKTLEGQVYEGFIGGKRPTVALATDAGLVFYVWGSVREGQ